MTAEDKLKAIVEIIESGIHDNGTDEHRLLLDGEYHTGVVVDWVYSMLILLRDFAKGGRKQ